MNKPITVCIALSMMMLVTVEVQATDFYFFNGAGGDSLWTNPDNWGNNGGSPLDLGYPGEFNPTDVVIARTGNGKRALITDGMDIAFDFLTSWSTYGTEPLNDGFDMTGGTMNLVGASSLFEMGSNGLNIPIEINISGGFVSARTGFLGGRQTGGAAAPIDSDATLNLSGDADVFFSGGLRIGADSIDALDSEGILNMSDDALLTADLVFFGEQNNGQANLADNATIVLLGDHKQEMDDAIAAGWLSGPNITATYDGGLDQTTVMVDDTGGPPGDFDGDGDVDGDDFLEWQTGFGTIYDGDDFLIWQQNFPTPGSGTGSGAVPEPGSGGLALIVAALLGPLTRRRRLP